MQHKIDYGRLMDYIAKETKYIMSDSEKKSGFDDWLDDLEEIPVNPACSIDNPDCESCSG